MNILVTGGAGYIGSHTAVELLNNDFNVTVVDNLSNSSAEAIKRVEQITGKSIDFHEFDLQDKTKLDELFSNNNFDAVIHFAGLKAVGESVQKPLLYYRTNLDSTLSLLEVMDKYDVRKLVFSSSATVYGNPETLPITESSPRSATNPYGQTKLMIEHILQDIAKSSSNWQFTLLRYFNPIGAHPSGLIGEDPNGIPNNLLPFVAQVAIGKLPEVAVFGNDYDTPDGTGVRDYIHVTDLAQGHVKALENIKPGANAYNLGTGQGTSVLEIIASFSKACGRDIPYSVKERREGDIASCYADANLAQTELDWQAKLTIDQACQDTWNWQSKNPNGYA